MPAMSGPMRNQEASAVSPDGQILATKADNGTVRLWGANGQLLRALHGHQTPVLCLAWSPDGSILVTAEQAVRLWDIHSGETRHMLHGHSKAVCAVAFCHTGDQVATGSLDDTVRLWDTDSGRCLSVLRGHSGAVTDVAWSPDGSVVGTASEDHTACLWCPSERGQRCRPVSSSVVLKPPQEEAPHAAQ